MENIKELSALDIHYLIDTFKLLIDAKVETIYQKENSLFLVFHQSELGKRILKIMLPKFIYMTDYKEEMPEKPPQFCTILRKHLKNARLRAISQLGFERILQLRFTTKDKECLLFVELFSPGNVILCNKSMKIIYPMQYQRWKDRLVKGGQQYKYPKKDFNVLVITKDELKDLLSASNMTSIVTFLAKELGFGGKYAEEVCKEIKLDKKIVPKNADHTKLYNSIQSIIKKKDKNLNEELNKLLTEKTIMHQKTQKEKKYKEKKGKVEKILDSQGKTAENLRNSVELNNKKGDFIYSNYNEIKNIISELREIKKKHSWKEIKEKLKGHNKIKKIDEKKGKITLQLP